MVVTENSHAYPGYDLRKTTSGRTVLGTQSRWDASVTAPDGNDFLYGITKAAEKTFEQNEGKVLGITTLAGKGNMSWGMVAQYASDSTKEDPIIQVTTNYEGKRVSYKVHVNEVDPANASALEMFALCNYSDDVGISKGGTFGSWQKLKVYGENAEYNGEFSEFRDFQGFFGKSLDWTQMAERMATRYRKAGIYNQYQSCKALEAMLTHFSENSKKDTGTLINNASKDGKEPDTAALMQIIAEHREEILKKLESGETGPKIPIGGMSLTEEEWEKLLKSFDKAEESIQQAVKAEQGEELPEKRPDTTINGNAVLAPEDTGHELKGLDELVADSVTCTYPADNGKDSVMYLTWYTEEGIFCKKAGETETLWSIPFDSPKQYEKVKQFLEQFDKTDNLRFASHENFWKDFLSGELDVDGFMEFYKTTDKGVPDYLIYAETGTYIDEEKAKYAKYMNAGEFTPVEEVFPGNMPAVWSQPFQLADKTVIDRTKNEIYLANGAEITLRGGYILTIRPRGIDISGGNPYDRQAFLNVPDMVWALSTLLRNASGQIKEKDFSSGEYEKWNRKVSEILTSMGIDTAKDFTINGAKYTKDSEGNFRKVS